MSARLKSHFRGNIAIIADDDAAVSVDFQVLANPAIFADLQSARALNRTDNARSCADFKADRVQQPALDSEVPRSRSCEDVVYQVQRKRAPYSPQMKQLYNVHYLYHPFRSIFARLHGPSSNKSGDLPFNSACANCKKRSAATSAFHVSANV